MKRKPENVEGIKTGSGTNNAESCREKLSFDNLFDFEWEELVVTKDKSGKIVPRLACCAGAPV